MVTLQQRTAAMQIELHSGGFSVTPFDIKTDRPPLLLRATSGANSAGSDEASDKTFFENAAGVVKQLAAASVERRVVIFGSTIDPFDPTIGRFDKALQLLEALSQQSPRGLIVQTRSPLVVLGLPVLRNLGQAVCVTVGLETMDDSTAARSTPELPRPSERVKMIRALHTFGIRTALQLAPIPSDRSHSHLAAFVTEAGCLAYVRTFAEIGGRGNRMLDSRSSSTLEARLKRACPERLVSTPVEAWQRVLTARGGALSAA
ncbi:MAG: hypothetical protein KDD69_08685 [Bdellovibrionales bacterium]|nr:hypothetical protein [Bdellovibrionales bacterium]